MAACSANATNPNVEVVAPEIFSSSMAEDPDAYLLDVRRPDEYAEAHLKGAHLLNWLDREAFERGAEDLDTEKTIYVYCRSGRRSNEAANYLADKGFKVIDMDGGILVWKKEGMPIETGERLNTDEVCGSK